jgi:DNA-binding sugar fermentation-stimulating protein
VAWNYYTCVSEFKLGSDYRVDFLILSAHSGYWHAIFIELKPVDAKLYIKDGTQSKELRVALKQIEDWKQWIRMNEGILRREFSKILKKDKAPAIWPYPILGYKKGHSSGANEIADISSNVHYIYHVVIGRRGRLSEEEQKRRSLNDIPGDAPTIATYDRLLEAAKRE